MTATTTHDEALRTFADEIGPAGPVAVAGHRTRWDLGGEIEAHTRIVAAPSGIVELHPSEMIARVRTGESVAGLSAALAEVGQRCALPDRGGTVGGALAVGENHVEVLGRGTLRASVLQIRYVGDGGEIVTGGGETVKNVSGFDLPRLMVGSLGTLGLFGEVLLRTNPTPAVSRWVVSTDADPLAARKITLRPGAVLWDGTSTYLLLEGHDVDVAAGLRSLADVGTWSEAVGPPDLPPHRWSLRPSQVVEHTERFGARFVASVGVGTVFADAPQPKRAVDDTVAALARRMKAQFDPTGRFSPGRTAGW